MIIFLVMPALNNDLTFNWLWPYHLLCFISMYSVLNTLSEYTYFYISKNITSYTFLLVLKIDESLHCILKNKYNFTSYQKTFHIESINLNRSKQYIFKYTLYIYTIKWGWLGHIFDIFYDLLTHCYHSTTWHAEYMTLCPHSLD